MPISPLPPASFSRSVQNRRLQAAQQSGPANRLQSIRFGATTTAKPKTTPKESPEKKQTWGEWFGGIFSSIKKFFVDIWFGFLGIFGVKRKADEKTNTTDKTGVKNSPEVTPPADTPFPLTAPGDLPTAEDESERVHATLHPEAAETDEHSGDTPVGGTRTGKPSSSQPTNAHLLKPVHAEALKKDLIHLILITSQIPQNFEGADTLEPVRQLNALLSQNLQTEGLKGVLALRNSIVKQNPELLDAIDYPHQLGLETFGRAMLNSAPGAITEGLTALKDELVTDQPESHLLFTLLTNILKNQGIRPLDYLPNNGRPNPKHHEISTNSVPTANPDLIGRIAKIDAPGYEHFESKQLLEPQQVTCYRYDPMAEAHPSGPYPRSPEAFEELFPLPKLLNNTYLPPDITGPDSQGTKGASSLNEGELFSLHQQLGQQALMQSTDTDRPALQLELDQHLTFLQPKRSASKSPPDTKAIAAEIERVGKVLKDAQPDANPVKEQLHQTYYGLLQAKYQRIFTTALRHTERLERLPANLNQLNLFAVKQALAGLYTRKELFIPEEKQPGDQKMLQHLYDLSILGLDYIHQRGSQAFPSLPATDQMWEQAYQALVLGEGSSEAEKATLADATVDLLLPALYRTSSWKNPNLAA